MLAGHASLGLGLGLGFGRRGHAFPISSSWPVAEASWAAAANSAGLVPALFLACPQLQAEPQVSV